MSSRQLKLWYLAHPTELALGSHCGFSWTKACFQELTGSSFHSVEKGRSEMEQHSYKPSTIYKLRIPFLLRDWEGAPAACTRYQQVPAAPQDQQSSLGLLWQPHFWWGCRPVPAEPSDKVLRELRLPDSPLQDSSANLPWKVGASSLEGCFVWPRKVSALTTLTWHPQRDSTKHQGNTEGNHDLWLSPHRP